MKILLPLVAVILFASAGCGQNANVIPTQQADRPVKILKKPHAAPGNCAQNEAVARVSVVFDKSGVIDDVSLTLPSGCAEFDDRAVDAARRIKYLPAVKNGETVTVAKQIEYKYERY
jgi:TonB family protein